MRIPGFLWVMSTLAVAACGGSSGGSIPEQDAGGLIQDACNNVVGLHCSTETQQQCTDSMNQSHADAVAKGCLSQFDALMKCFANQVTDCSQDSSVVCSTQIHALDDCETQTGSNNCSSFTGSTPPGAPSYYQSCGLTCSGWSVQCETKTSPTLECTCTTGAKAGTAFTAPSCTDLTSSLAAPFCQ